MLFHHIAKLIALSTLVSGALCAFPGQSKSYNLGIECANQTMKGLIHLIKNDSAMQNKAADEVYSIIQKAALDRDFLIGALNSLQSENVKYHTAWSEGKDSDWHVDHKKRAQANVLRFFGIQFFERALELESKRALHASSYGLFSKYEPLFNRKELILVFAEAIKQAISCEESERMHCSFFPTPPSFLQVAKTIDSLLCNMDQYDDYTDDIYLMALVQINDLKLLRYARIAADFIAGNFGCRVTQFLEQATFIV